MDISVGVPGAIAPRRHHRMAFSSYHSQQFAYPLDFCLEATAAAATLTKLSTRPTAFGSRQLTFIAVSGHIKAILSGLFQRIWSILKQRLSTV